VLIVNLSATNGTLAALTSASYEARAEGPLDVVRVIQLFELKVGFGNHNEMNQVSHGGRKQSN
jgi:hypothetical protein